MPFHQSNTLACAPTILGPAQGPFQIESWTEAVYEPGPCWRMPWDLLGTGSRSAHEA